MDIPWVDLGLWVFSKLSGDETFPEDAPRAELTLCSPPPTRPHFCAQGEPLLQILQEGIKAPAGDCGFQDTSPAHIF